MNRRNFFVMMMGNLAWVLLPGCGKNSQPDANPDAATARAESNEVSAYEEENEKQLVAAIQREKEQQRLAEAAAHRKEYREQLQYTFGDAWTKYLNQNMRIFMALRQQAAHSPSHTAPCTICDGRGQAGFCVLCKNSGKCPTCNGAGVMLGGAICPTCLGKNVCFLCHGAGRMLCAFCDDGSVYVNQPNPPDKIPIG